MFIAVPKAWGQPKCLWIIEWTRKMCHTYTMKFYSAIKKSEISPFATTWMDLEEIMLNEMSQTEKDKYCRVSSVYGI